MSLKGSAAPSIKRLKSAIVDLVNPRFHRFNKPFFISVTILIPWFSLFLCGWYLLALLEETNQMIIPGNKYQSDIVNGHYGNVECVSGSALLKVAGNKENVQVHWCVIPDPDKMYCSPGDRKRAGHRKCFESEVVITRNDGYQYLSSDDTLMIFYKQRTYTHAGALGVALGYASMLEVVLTLPIISCLWCCGLISTKGSSMIQWIKLELQSEGAIATMNAIRDEVVTVGASKAESA